MKPSPTPIAFSLCLLLLFTVATVSAQESEQKEENENSSAKVADSTDEASVLEKIARVNDSHLESLRSCYVKHVSKASRKHGDTMRLTVAVAKTGIPSSVEIADTTAGDETFCNCVLGVFYRLDYGDFDSGTRFELRLGFDSKASGMVAHAPKPAGGRLTSEKVVALANAHMKEFMACYADQLDDHPGLAGTVRVKVVVGADGNVDASRIESSTLGTPVVGTCILRVLKTIEFPAPGENAPVIARLPFQFGSH